MVNTIGICFLLTHIVHIKCFGWLSTQWFSDSGLFSPLTLPFPCRPKSPIASARRWGKSGGEGSHTYYLTTSAWKWLTPAYMPLVRTSHVASSKYKGPWLGKCFPEATQHQGRTTGVFGRELAICNQHRMKYSISCVDFYPLSCIIVFSLNSCY